MDVLCYLKGVMGRGYADLRETATHKLVSFQILFTITLIFISLPKLLLIFLHKNIHTICFDFWTKGCFENAQSGKIYGFAKTILNTVSAFDGKYWWYKNISALIIAMLTKKKSEHPWCVHVMIEGQVDWAFQEIVWGLAVRSLCSVISDNQYVSIRIINLVPLVGLCFSLQ